MQLEETLIDQLKVLALIPARGGSKGIYHKNIKSLAGVPLIAYSIMAAQRSAYIDDIVVTTDDESIANVAIRYGAEVPFLRPAEMAGDRSKTIDCVIHARDTLFAMGRSYDLIVLLQPTSPLRTAEDVDSALEVCVEHGCLGLCSLGIAEDNPLLLRTMGEGGVVHPIINQGSTVRRQDVPTYYRVDGSIYINQASSLSLATSLNDNPIGYVMPKGRAIDIDTIDDFHEAEAAILRQNED